MASAMLTALVETVPVGSDISLRYIVYFYGADMAAPDYSIVTVTFTAGDTAQNMRTKMSQAIAAEASRLGYSVSASAMILPSFQRG